MPLACPRINLDPWMGVSLFYVRSLILDEARPIPGLSGDVTIVACVSGVEGVARALLFRGSVAPHFKGVAMSIKHMDEV